MTILQVTYNLKNTKGRHHFGEFGRFFSALRNVLLAFTNLVACFTNNVAQAHTHAARAGKTGPSLSNTEPRFRSVIVMITMASPRFYLFVTVLYSTKLIIS
ncbi:hypothetical protein C5L25_002266 [Secundilactobacillus silagei JCM 19001]|uniref:Uncharacterized protein n=1 Tax=Secundilactobacillus silagei JCM 19001 TaxID=1302250 RepID=A0A1Z5IFS4_9LACO|nr:hypothetical protein C5L25_002266 [Secundilactobacillus silagei JCM 19001]GAX00402.1 hypothetical protein IWT126_00417 [Secundilactobacillus silagei JCM 19001]